MPEQAEQCSACSNTSINIINLGNPYDYTTSTN